MYIKIYTYISRENIFMQFIYSVVLYVYMNLNLYSCMIIKEIDNEKSQHPSHMELNQVSLIIALLISG